jgi:hypothetical protein
MHEQTRTEHVAPVAGIPIIHEIDQALALMTPATPDWTGGQARAEPLVIRHRVGDVSVDGLRPVMEVAPWSTYFDSADGTAVRYYSHSPAQPVQVLRSIRAGYEYVIDYAFAPVGPVSRRDKEMAAYTLALGARDYGLMAHGCGFVLPTGRVALCLGVSGAGKSTLARLMQTRPGVKVLNDDRIVVTRDGTGVRASAAAWPGSEGIAINGEGPLGFVGLIARSASATIRRLNGRESVQRFLTTIALPVWNAAHMDSGLALIDQMLRDVPVFEIGYPLGDRTAEWLERTLVEMSA